MRIIVIDTTLHTTLIGGAQTFLPALLQGFTEKGHEVHLVTQGSPDTRIRKQLYASGASIHSDLWNKNSLVEDAAPVFAYWVNAMQPDIYLISVSADIGWVTLPFLHPHIATLTIGHTDSDTFYLPARHYQHFLTQAIGVSDQVCRSYTTLCGISAKDVSWIPYGVTTNNNLPALPGAPALRLIYVGRLEEHQKRVSDLVKLVHQLTAEKILFHLHLIGDGPESTIVREELQPLIEGGMVTMPGWLPTEEVITALRQSEIFILTSAYEGFCIALVEAMANGCCPLVTEIKSGNNQLIQHEKNGFIFPIGGVAAFINKIRILANQRDHLYEVRKNAWETGKLYSIDRMIDNYLEVFRIASEKSKSSSRKVDVLFPLLPSCRSPYPKWLRRIKMKFNYLK